MARFKVGDIVRVIYGRYTGTIVKIIFVDPLDAHAPYRAARYIDATKTRYRVLWYKETDVAPLRKVTYAAEV